MRYLNKEFFIYVNPEEGKKTFQEMLMASHLFSRASLSNNRFRIKSKEKFYFGSWIEREHFSINGIIKEHSDKIKISYRVRGNETFAICNMMGLLMLIPTFVIIYSVEKQGHKQNLNVSENNLEIVLVLLIVGLFWFLFFTIKQVSLRKKGEKTFKEFLMIIDSKIKNHKTSDL